MSAAMALAFAFIGNSSRARPNRLGAHTLPSAIGPVNRCSLG